MMRRCFTQSPNCKVVGFRPTGNKNYLVLPGTNRSGDFATRSIYRSSGLLTVAMNARSIAKSVSQAASHHGRDLGVYRSRGAVVQINLTFWVQNRIRGRKLSGKIVHLSGSS